MHASGESFQESRMREIRTSGLTRGRATALPTLPLEKEKFETRSPALGGEKRFSSSPGEREVMTDRPLFFPLP